MEKLLTDTIKETKEKLDTSKTAAESANEQLANGEISQKQYDALQREHRDRTEAEGTGDAGDDHQYHDGED